MRRNYSTMVQLNYHSTEAPKYQNYGGLLVTAFIYDGSANRCLSCVFMNRFFC